MSGLWGLAATGTQWVLYLGGLTAAGGALVAVLFGSRDVYGPAARWAVLGLLAAVLGFSLKGVGLTGQASGMIDAQMLALLWSTKVGTALLLQGLGFVALVVASRAGRLAGPLALLGALGVLAGFLVVGHIADKDRLWLDIGLALHLAAAALWIGVLAPLYRRARDPRRITEAARLGHAFGRVALWAIPVLGVAGVVMAWQLMGQMSDLWTTQYGRVLLAKMALVGAVLSLGAVNKLRLIPALGRGDGAAAQTLARVVVAEWILIALVLAATAALTTQTVLPAVP